MTDCLFCKIARGEIPSKKVYEDEEVYAFHDIHPVAPVHFMLIPKLHVVSLMEIDDSHAGIECGGIELISPFFSKRPRRGPAMIAAAKQDAPPVA